MEELFNSLFNAYPSTYAFNPIFFLLMQFMFKFMPFFPESSTSFLQVTSCQLQWNILLNILLKQKSLTCISSQFLLHLPPCHFQINLLKWTPHTSCLHSITSHSLRSLLQLARYLPCPSNLLISRWKPLDILFFFFFFEPSITFDIFVCLFSFDQHPPSNTCLLRHYTICFLFYFYSHIFSFFFCAGSSIGICP